LGVYKLNYEIGLDNFEKMKRRLVDYGSFLTEADTRCKIIDEILLKCLGWQEENIKREFHVETGYIDYILIIDGKRLVIEAKKVGNTFTIPVGISCSSNLKIKDLLKKDDNLNEHYEQVLKYCIASSIPFGCLTNGFSWIIFPAFRTDGIEQKNSKVVIFKDLNDIENNFVHFWNLFSNEAIKEGKLSEILLVELKTIPPSFLINSEERRNQILNRNYLSGILSPILKDYFSDLTGPNSIDKLEKCYVEIDEAISLDESTGDSRGLSKTIARDPSITQFESIQKVYNNLDYYIDSFIEGKQKSGVVYILLGRVGAGKTTFLYHYFYISKKRLDEISLIYYLNWLEMGQQKVSEFFYEKIDSISNQSLLFQNNSKIDTIEKAFEQEINSLKNGPLGRIKESALIEQKIGEMLFDLSMKKDNYYSKLIPYLKREKKISTIIIFDNIDQLDPKLQEEIVNFAFSIYTKWQSFTLIALREENYLKSKQQGSLSTIQSHRVYLPKQSIMPILDKRLECLANDIASDSTALSPNLSDLYLTALDIRQFIILIKDSIVSERVRVKDFLESIALGNLRESLDFFLSFLLSENTDTRKIISFMKDGEKYLVPDHEFIKSIALGSKQFFSESDSPILNLFSVMDMQNPSHFTKLRILNFLRLIENRQCT